jgi:hypothetical protein
MLMTEPSSWAEDTRTFEVLVSRFVALRSE